MRSIVDAVNSDQLALPSLPDVALRTLELSRRKDVSVARLAQEVGRDPALAARLVRVANGAAYYGRPVVRTLPQAVTRVGFRLTGVMAAALATDCLYRSHLTEMASRLRKSRANGVEVAAISRAVARRFTSLDPDEAMLGGLLHEIGVLPIVEMASRDEELRRMPQVLDEAIAQVQARIGERLLRSWNFPSSLVAVPVGCTQLERPGVGPPDIADVVCVARLHGRPLREASLGSVDPAKVAAYGRLGIGCTGLSLAEGLEEEIRINSEMLEP